MSSAEKARIEAGVGFSSYGLNRTDVNDDPTPGITFKTSAADYELLREMPGLRPAPYLASRGMKWIQRHDRPGLIDDDLRHCISESYRIVKSGFSHRKRSELGL
ncbi:MAG: hypothetical protein NT070_16180 [Cyanobacteria bacterium]|nr:hypothetical protein [Cyanobacteriota bacterium]